jgi:hypothetical protein
MIEQMISQYITPTPYPTLTAVPQFMPDFEVVQIVDGYVQGYNLLNSTGMIDAFKLAIVVVMVIGGFLIIARQIQGLGEVADED